ncbi:MULTISPECIES: transcriptional regulator GutM [unclassified Clostridioides]|uniref:transcriptional regulator GutM n=1 Tax=unclassified Clostridioides TaxID=2635829 RepID=UPI0006BBEF4E|nr:sorbitol operon activator protein (glucitol) [Clostridioides difficile]MCC0692112.1 transcriptional regulator GutM [Clostridioides sp. ZZV14-6387]MCI9977104.1 transcriptional regulator GutM [Clostridioides difficile]MDB3083878.1 transcriptional regulator [Clostridioides difficile]MDI0267784.1 transcriptional regulator GutM [Clostridioides difficile]
MDPVIFIIVSLIAVYLLNIFLGYLQLKDFNKNYIELKRKGRVAIGRKKGRISSGTIVLILIDEDGAIVETRKMQGVTVLARVKVFEGLVGKDLGDITKSDLAEYNKLLKKAILDAVKQYITFEKNRCESTNSTSTDEECNAEVV